MGDMLRGGDGAAVLVGDGQQLTPRIVGVSGQEVAIAIGKGNDVTLQVFEEIERGAVVLDTADAVLIVVQGDELVVCPGLPMHKCTIWAKICQQTNSPPCRSRVGSRWGRELIEDWWEGHLNKRELSDYVLVFSFFSHCFGVPLYSTMIFESLP